MKGMARRIALLAVLATGVLFTSCLFDTRDAQPPVTGGGGGCTLDSPQKVFVCMTNALTAHQDGDYERSISEDFVFSPTLADSLDQNFTGIDPSPYANWGKQTELNVLALMLADNSVTIPDFGTPSLLINKNTFVRYNVTYSLLVISNAATPDTTTYKGVAQIDVRNENGNWRVTFWNEVETVAGSSTWGFLRGILKLRT
jgi:hypothetical protein